MSLTLRRVATLAAPVLLAGSLSSCGMLGGGPPTDASEQEFCDANNSLYDALGEAVTSGQEPETSEVYDAFQDQAGQLEEVGTPEGISDEAREGFEVYVDTVQSADEDEFTDAFEGDADDADIGDLSDEEEDRLDDFTEYAGSTCPNPLEDLAPGGSS